MYIPNKFSQTDNQKLEAMINDHPLATLVSFNNDGCEAEHLPLMLTHQNDKVFLHGHIAKANPLWKSIESNTDVLVIFHGPNSYISPNYYPSKQQNGRAVPTWNYAVVHVKGVISFIHEADWKLSMLNDLTDKHELPQGNPWKVADAPSGYIESMLPAIVGVAIEVKSMIGKWKVSQNQSKENQQGVGLHLAQENTDNSVQVAHLVNEHLTADFS